MHFLLRAVLALAFAVGLSAQTTHPDFSGHWVMISPYPGNEHVIRQDVTALTMGPAVEGKMGPTITYKLDGSESKTPMKVYESELVMVSKASWKGEQLVITSTSSTVPSGVIKFSQTLTVYLNEQGQLVIRVENDNDPPANMVYRKH